MKKKAVKIISLLFALAVMMSAVFVLAGCGNNNNTASGGTNSAAPANVDPTQLLKDAEDNMKKATANADTNVDCKIDMDMDLSIKQNASSSDINQKAEMEMDIVKYNDLMYSKVSQSGDIGSSSNEAYLVKNGSSYDLYSKSSSSSSWTKSTTSNVGSDPTTTINGFTLSEGLEDYKDTYKIAYKGQETVDGKAYDVVTLDMDIGKLLSSEQGKKYLETILNTGTGSSSMLEQYEKALDGAHMLAEYFITPDTHEMGGIKIDLKDFIQKVYDEMASAYSNGASAKANEFDIELWINALGDKVQKIELPAAAKEAK